MTLPCYACTDTDVVMRDMDGINPDVLKASLEMSRLDWELIVECLENAGFSSSNEGRVARVHATGLARQIRDEIINNLPGGTAVMIAATTMQEPISGMLPFIIRELLDRPHLDLNNVSEPWMYLRSRGVKHDIIGEHIDEAIKWVREIQRRLKEGRS